MAYEKLNDLGSNYADLNAVWSLHPEGGREGDYLKIGNTTYYWDKLERDWKVGSLVPTPATQGEVIDGDLTVGGNLSVGGDATVVGTLTVGEINVANGDRFKGQSSYKSIVFKRSETKPNAPASRDGSFDNPVPGGGWSDGVPGGNAPIWMSTRVFTSDAKPPQEDAWSDPALMSDAENFDVEFSMAATDTVPAAPTTSNLGYTWFDPVRDRNNPYAHWDQMNWMATRTKSVNSQGAAVWSDWTIVLIKGEAGEGVQTVYRVTDGSVPTISGTNYPPSGWSINVDALTLDTGSVLWMSERKFTGGAWSAWSSPIRISGEDGEAGKDAPNIEFIYKRMNRLPNTGGQTDTAPESVDSDHTIPTGWEDHPQGVDETHKYEWMCQRIKPQGGSWGNWVGPFVWSAWGEKGMDGDGVEYVFKLTEDDDAPSTPSTSDGTINSNGEFIPTGWTDGPTGVSKSMPYEWVSQRKRINGTWGAFKAPALWATYSEEHTVDINENGYWVIDGVTTDKMAVGTGVTIKGRVDVYSDDEITGNQTSLESYPSDPDAPSELEIGDCWIVETGTDGNDQDVSGHLFICVATTGTLTNMWKDLGEFKGEPGESSYLHIAWAQNVTFSPFTVSNPTTNPTVGRNYDWMGIKVTKTEAQPSWSEYKWNYLRGKDGMDVEYVYIRTTVNTAPTITEDAVQSAERLPKVGNYNSDNYSADQIDGDTFKDDPNGVSDTWPYEWMSKRERTNGVWGTFLSPARLWAKWGEPGESAVTVKTEPVMVVVDADEDGELPSQTPVRVKAWLYYGEEAITPSTASCSASYGGTPITIGTQAIDPSDPFVTITIPLPGSVPLQTKDLVITLVKQGLSASTTVPIVINRKGAQGQSVYRSTVFRFYEPTQAKPIPDAPSPNGGDYYHPADVVEVGVWFDGIPSTGSGPLWMSHRLFTSDGLAPQEATWSTPMLAQDIENSMDVEYSPNAVDDVPAAPNGTNQSGSGQIWFDPVRDRNNPYAHWDQMNWMAIRTREVNAGGYPEWGSWTISLIRGEKGKDGAGQAYIATSIDQIVVDCDAEGRPKAAVSAYIEARLMWGDEACGLAYTQCRVTEDVAGGIQVNYPIDSQTSKRLTAAIEYSISAGQGAGGSTPQFPVLSSGLITIVLEGVGSNSVTHIATKTIPVIANVQGATGATGPVLRFRGEWSDSESYTFNDIFRDCVKHNDIYYILAEAHDGYTTEPGTTGSPWTSMGSNMKFFATEILLAENAAINLLSSNVISLFNGAVKTASINEDGNGSYVIYYQVAPYGKMMEFSAKGFIIYYHNDTDNTVAWTLGYGGDINKAETSDDWKPIRLKKLLPRETTEENINANTHYVLETYYQFIAGSGSQFSAYGGKIFKGCSTLNPSLETIIDSGNYTRQQDAVQDLGEGKWAVTTYPVSNGIIDFSDPTTHYGATI